MCRPDPTMIASRLEEEAIRKRMEEEKEKEKEKELQNQSQNSEVAP